MLGQHRDQTDRTPIITYSRWMNFPNNEFGNP